MKPLMAVLGVQFSFKRDPFYNKPRHPHLQPVFLAVWPTV